MPLPKNFYKSWSAEGNPTLLDAFKQPAGALAKPSLPKPAVPQPAPQLSNNTYDIAGLFSQGVGRPITVDELQGIREAIGGTAGIAAGDPADIVSKIQEAIKKIPRTVNTPADQFRGNSAIVNQYQQQQEQKKAAAPAVAPTADPLQEQIQREGGITAEEARRAFGSDFTGVQQIGDRYFPDATAIARLRGQSTQPAGAEEPTAPTYGTTLPDTERQVLEQQQTADIAAAEQRSQQRKAEIQRLGETRQGQARSYLAGRNILGRTITGAPVETGLGELSNILNKTNAAIGEEDARLQQEINDIKAGTVTKSQARLTELNKLKSQEFEDRLKLQSEKRLGAGEVRQLYKDLYDVAKDIPKGQVAKFGDQYVTGLKEVAPKIREFEKYDANTGKLVFGGVDETTGEPIYQYELEIGDPKEIENWKSVVVEGRLLAFNESIGEYRDTGTTVPKQYKPTAATGAKSGAAGTAGGVTKSPTEISEFSRSILKNPKLYYTITPTERGHIIKELSDAGVDIGPLTEGKKAKLAATQQDDLVQAQLARAGVIKLKGMLDQLQKTGPVIGRARQINPYDPQVVAIMAEITRIVPGLARGVFKEVGVLTDTDIDRYTRTLANPTATKEQIEALHKDTLEKIDTSLRILTKTYKDLNLDLGSFAAPGDTTATPTAGIDFTKYYE